MSTLELFDALTVQLSIYLGSFDREPSSYAWIGEFIFRWQTIIAAAIAFVPASLAAVFVWRQVREQGNQFRQAAEQRARHARLRLIYSLPRMSRQIDEFYTHLVRGEFDPSNHAFLQDNLNDILEAGVVSQPETFDFIKRYVSLCQQYSSMVRLYADQAEDRHLAKMYHQLAVLDIFTDALYPFVRFETETILEPNITGELVEQYLLLNLRRNNRIDGTNLERLFNSNQLPGA